MMSLSEAAHELSARSAGGDAVFDSVSTDSRTLRPGSLFIALRGEHHDGHAFVKGAKAAGAVGAVVDEAWCAGGEAQALRGAAADVPFIVVPDTLAALGQLATRWRQRFSLPLIGVVGSNGKTTVKEMIAAILRAHFGVHETLATEGNFNNAIGLPLTLLRLRGTHRAAVIEIGMNHPGETAQLAAIAQPGIGLINNAQREHQEFMKSVADVAGEHAALVRALPQGGTAVLNADDAFFSSWRDAAAAAGATVRDFGIDRPACVSGRFAVQGFTSRITLSLPQGEARFSIALPGAHNVRNAAAAAAAATAAGAAIEAVEKGLSGFAGVKGRQQRKTGLGGGVVIDDSYNANPESVRAAIDVLAACAGPSTLVLGDMGEVGEKGPEFHREIGDYARTQGVDVLLGLGELTRHAIGAFGTSGRHASALAELLPWVRERDRPGATLLVKGSRFMRMERVVDALTGAAEQKGAH